MLRMLLIDDSAVFTDAVIQAMESFDSVEVVDVCRDGLHGIQVASGAQVDFALVDLKMPGVDGVRTARLLRAAHPELFIVIVSLDSSGFSAQAINCGDAQHFVHKRNLFERLPALLAECDNLRRTKS